LTIPPITPVVFICCLQVFTEEGLIYMVQEYGEIDLARLLAKHDATRRAAAGADLAKGALLQDNLDENFIRLYWQQMLQVRTLQCFCEWCCIR
jgi:serine/threonine-protein kinase TTK/MPS1